MPSGRKAESRRAAYAQAAAAITTIVGLMALSGWLFHLPTLTSVLPGSVHMKANTSICMMACGAALLILARRTSSRAQKIAQLLAVIPVTIGLTTLAEYCFGWQMQIDELLFRDTVHAFSPFAGRMSPFSAAAFVAIGASLATMPLVRLKRASLLAAVSAAAVGVISLVGYLWNADELVTDSWLPPVAVNTAICFVLLGSGVLLAPAAMFNGKIAALAEVETKILGGVVFAMALLVFGGSYTYRANVRFAESVAWVTHTQEVRATVANTSAALAGAELALRDYLLYAQPDRWKEYQHLIGIAKDSSAATQSLTADNPAQRANVTALRDTVDERVADMASVLTAYQHYGLPAARALTRILQRNAGTQAVGEIADNIDSIETALLRARQAAAERGRRSTLIALLATLAVASVLFVVFFRGIHREMRARHEAENALRVSDRYNRSIIDSSPDCLAILDLDARLLQMTPHGLALMEIEDFSTVANSDWRQTWLGSSEGEAAEAVTCARNGSPGRFQGFYKTTTGLSTWWDVIVMPILGADGRAAQLLVAARDITERRLAEEAIRDLNAELREKANQLEATNKELESFTYTVSHDLRAPLRAIDGFALMIEEDCKDSLAAEGQRYLTVIRDNSQKMGILIDDLLVFSRLGRQPMASRDVNIDSLVREVIKDTAWPAAEPKFNVGPLPPARGDRGLLRQVWVNLIANAVKYSGEAPEPCIQITGSSTGSETHYVVRDNGVGFNMAYVGKLFGVFQRLHRVDEFAGTGVGLAIVHRIVTRHGGRVWAEGEIGQGATFSFALPNGDDHG